MRGRGKKAKARPRCTPSTTSGGTMNREIMMVERALEE